MTSLGEFCRSHGVDADPPLDGKFHRYRHTCGPGDVAWVRFWAEPVPRGVLGCWRCGIKENWLGVSRSLTPEERRALREAEKLAEAEVAAEQEAVAVVVSEAIRFLPPAESNNPYLAKKGIRSHPGMYEQRGRMITPTRDVHGKIWSAQGQSATPVPEWGNRTKSNEAHGRTKGCFVALGDVDNGEQVAVCEGVATGCTIHELTGIPVACSMYAGNMPEVASAFRMKRGPSVRLIIAGDNDRHTNGNPGATKARLAADKVGGVLVLPDFGDIAPAKDATDFNDLARLRGPAAVVEAFRAATQPAHSPFMEARDAVRGELVGILTEKKMGASEKHRAIAGAVVDALSRVGRFYHHAELRDFANAWFFSDETKRLERVRGDAFGAWLSSWICINRADAAFRFVERGVETSALCGDLTTAVLPEAYWAGRPGAAYLSCGDGRAVKVDSSGARLVANGTDGVLFPAGRTLKPWTLVPVGRDPFDRCSVFRGAKYSAPHGLDLLRVWAVSLPTSPRSKPPICTTGDVGSGKTRLIKGLAELFGIPFTATKPEDDGEDDFWPTLDGGGLAVLDNADSRVRWLPDALAAAATDGCSQRRRLYTNAETVILRPRAWVAVTSANPLFASDAGLADRLMVVRMGRREGEETADRQLSDEIAAARDEGLSWIAHTLARAFADFGAVPSGLNKRHPDFAAFAVRIGRAMGREAEVIGALGAAESDKGRFCLENDPLGSALLAALGSDAEVGGSAKEVRDRLALVDADLAEWSPKRVGKRLAALWPHLSKSVVASHEKNRTGVTEYTFRAPHTQVLQGLQGFIQESGKSPPAKGDSWEFWGNAETNPANPAVPPVRDHCEPPPVANVRSGVRPPTQAQAPALPPWWGDFLAAWKAEGTPRSRSDVERLLRESGGIRLDEAVSRGWLETGPGGIARGPQMNGQHKTAEVAR